MKIVLSLIALTAVNAFAPSARSFGATKLAAEVSTETETASVEAPTEVAAVEETFMAPVELDAVRLPARSAPASCADMPGVLEPVGFWDPLFLSKGASPALMKTYREMELSHGRTAMLAFIGMIVGEGIAHETSLAIAQETPIAFWVGLALPIGAIETARVKIYGQKSEAMPADFYDWDYEQKIPGDFDFDYSYGYPETNEFGMQTQYSNYEIQNGRLAMLGVMGTLIQELVTGKPYF